MLVIRAAQMELLRQARWREFEAAALRHCEEHFPEACQAFGADETRSTVRTSLQKALGFGFEDAADLLKFLNLTFTFGSDFDQLPWAREIFDEPDYLPGTRIELLTEVASEQFGPPPAAADAPAAGADATSDDDPFAGWVHEPRAPVPAPPALEPATAPPAVPDLFRLDNHFAW